MPSKYGNGACCHTTTHGTILKKQVSIIPPSNPPVSQSKQRHILASGPSAGGTPRRHRSDGRTVKTRASGLAPWSPSSSQIPPNICWDRGLPGKGSTIKLRVDRGPFFTPNGISEVSIGASLIPNAEQTTFPLRVRDVSHLRAIPPEKSHAQLTTPRSPKIWPKVHLPCRLARRGCLLLWLHGSVDRMK